MTDTATSPTARQNELSRKHFEGSHAATPHIDCPECQNLGYVGNGFDNERIKTGTA